MHFFAISPNLASFASSRFLIGDCCVAAAAVTKEAFDPAAVADDLSRIFQLTSSLTEPIKTTQKDAQKT
jgi:hypothetical protein